MQDVGLEAYSIRVRRTFVQQLMTWTFRVGDYLVVGVRVVCACVCVVCSQVAVAVSARMPTTDRHVFTDVLIEIASSEWLA